MTAPNIQSARRDVQQQSLVVDVVRRRIYANPQPATQEALWDELCQAQFKLHQLLKTLRKLELESNMGLLFKTNEDVTTPGVLGRDTTGIDLKVQLRMERIPTSTVHLLDAKTHPLVTYQVENVANKPVRLRFSSYVEGYSASTVNTVEIPRRGKTEICQLPTFFPDRLSQVTELTRATLHVKVDDLDGAQELYNTYPIWLLSRSSTYLAVLDPSNGHFVDLRHFLAAWVTPHVEEMMKMLRDAADQHPDACIAGYQGDAQFVEMQVRAVYDALKRAEITYINSIICFGHGNGEYMQRVRLPRETLSTRSANCVDGTVLFASLLEAASINPGIILVPGHAFLGWQCQERGSWDYLETTMVSKHGFDEAHELGQHLAKKHQELADKNGEAFFKVISIAEARSDHGITPME